MLDKMEKFVLDLGVEDDAFSNMVYYILIFPYRLQGSEQHD